MRRNVNDESFSVDVLDRSQSVPVVVEFWAPWSTPSVGLGADLAAAVEGSAGEVDLVRVNVDECPQMVTIYGIQSIPAVVSFHDRKVLTRFVGVQSADDVRKFVNALPVVGSQPAPAASMAAPANAMKGPPAAGKTAEVVAASQAAVQAIVDGRKRVVAACAQRTSDENAYSARAAQERADYDARIRTLDEWACATEERIRSAAGWGKGIDRALRDATERARVSTSRPPMDSRVTNRNPNSGSFATATGEGMAVVDEAVRQVSAAAAKARKGALSRMAHSGALAAAAVTAQTVVFSARERIESLRVERDSAAVALANERAAAKARNDAAVRSAATDLENTVAGGCGRLNQLLAGMAPVARPGWNMADWSNWAPSGVVEPVYLGGISAPPNAAQAEFPTVPTDVVSFTDDLRRLGGVRYAYSAATRSVALSAGRSLVARLLAAVPPGKARFTFFDPLGLGEAVAPFLALADHDPRLIDGKVWSSADGLRSRLADHMDHIEVVIQKYLRGEYETIEDYNAAAGEIAEPYRFLFVYDFPAQFDESTFHQLSRIIENGPRCGVYTVLLANTDTPLPHGVSLTNLPPMATLAPGGPLEVPGFAPLNLAYDSDPIGALGAETGQWIIDTIVDKVGRAGRGADNVTVDLPKALRLYGETVRAGVRSDVPPGTVAASAEDPSSWWGNSSVDALAAPIGQSGARDVALLRFDSEILSGGLLVGRPGAGKSTLLHSYIGGLCSLYPPSELELYLIDFREGVEFKAYAEAGLPHARCVAVESERDFGVSVLESIVTEMKRRGELIRSTGGEQTSFARLREALDEPLPRIVLVFDEFHVLFSEDDKIGATAADYLETIIRQGRGFGVHVLLGSQSLAGLDALGRHVLQLLPIRVLLPSSESDAHQVLGDGNDAWRLLNRRGEGVLNNSAGAVEANVPFQAAFEAEENRLLRLKQLRDKADAAGLLRRPIVFEGYGATDLTATSPHSFVSAFGERSPFAVPLRVGTPMSLSGPMDVELRREGGANALIVARGSQDVPLGVTLSGLSSAAASTAQPRIEFVDFTALDEGVEEALKPLLEAGVVSLTRRRAAERVVGSLAAEVSRRVDEDDVRSPAVLLVLYGVHRARDLDPDGGSGMFDSEPAEDMMSSLKQILVNGPEVGVHVVAWADSAASLERRLPRSLVREFGTVVVGSMGRDDSQALVDSDVASTLKSHQIAVYNDDAGTVQRGRSYSVPSSDWLQATATQIGSARNTTGGD